MTHISLRTATLLGIATLAVGTSHTVQAAPLAHCVLEGEATFSPDRSTTKLTSHGTASCVGSLGNTTVVRGTQPYGLQGQVARGPDDGCLSIGAATGKLVFHVPRVIAVMQPPSIEIHSDIAILGGASGVLSGTGDDGVNNLGIAGTALFHAATGCDAGVLRLDFDVVPRDGSPRRPEAETAPARTNPAPERAKPRPSRQAKRSRCRRARRHGRHARRCHSRPGRRAKRSR